MTLKICYIEDLAVYPDFIKDIINEICIQHRKFSEMIIWYGDGFDNSIFNESEGKLTFKETYLLDETLKNKSIYIPYNKIYEIIIDYNQVEED